MWELQLLIEGEWLAVGPSIPEGAPAFRWYLKRDATSTMLMLFGHIPQDKRRLVRIPVGG